MSRHLAVKSCRIVIDGGNLLLTCGSSCSINIFDALELSATLQILCLLDLPVKKDVCVSYAQLNVYNFAKSIH